MGGGETPVSFVAKISLAFNFSAVFIWLLCLGIFSPIYQFYFLFLRLFLGLSTVAFYFFGE